MSLNNEVTTVVLNLARNVTSRSSFASEFNIIEFNGFEEVKPRVVRARQAAEAADRDPDTPLISTVLNVVGVDNQAELEDVIGERAHQRGIEPHEEKQRIKDLDIPIGTWDQVYETLHKSLVPGEPGPDSGREFRLEVRVPSRRYSIVCSRRLTTRFVISDVARDASVR